MQHSLVDLHVKVQASGIWCLGNYLTVVTHGLVDWHISCIQTLKQREKADPAAYPTNRYIVEGTCAREGGQSFGIGRYMEIDRQVSPNQAKGNKK